MKFTCDVVIEYDDIKKTENVSRSIEVDNLGFVESQINGRQLEAHIESKSISSLIHTLDDYLACVSVAEKIVDKD